MTVGVDDELRIREYAGDDSANPRPVPFKFLANDDLKVTRVNADGSETLLVRGTHYSVAGAGVAAGGSVTPLAAIASGTSWRIEGDMPLGQPTDYTAGDDFPAESHERGLDRSMIAHQEARRDINDTAARALMLPRGETAGPLPSIEDLKGKFPGMDLDGKWYASFGSGEDGALRGDLANIGAALVKYRERSSKAKLDDTANLRDFGGNADNDVAGDLYVAAMAAKLEGFEVMRLPYVPGEADIGYFSQFPSTTDFVGLTFDIDPRITLSLPDKNSTGAQNSQGIRWANLTKLYSRDLDTLYDVDPDGAELWYGNGRKKLSARIDPLLVSKNRPYLIDPATLVPEKRAYPAGEAWADDAASKSVEGHDVILAPGDDDSLHIVWRPGLPGDEIMVAMTGLDADVDLAGAIRHENGDAGMFCAADRSSRPFYFAKDYGGAAGEVEIGVLGPGTHGSYSGLGSVWSIRIDDFKHYSILLNGVVMIGRQPTSGVITHIGYGMISRAAAQTARIQEPVRKRSNKSQGGVLEAIYCLGDSKASLRYDCFSPYLKDHLEHSAGIRCWKILNRAVGGHDVNAQLAVITADEAANVLPNFNTVYIPLGTNDVQGQTGIGDFYTKLSAIVVKAAGVGAARKVIMGIPSSWYGQAQSGGSGQPSQNADRGAYYRMLVWRIAAEHGCQVVDPLEFEGHIVANYRNPAIEPMMVGAGNPGKDDNIHDTTAFTRMHAEEVAKIIAGFHAGPRNGLYLPLHTIKGTGSNGWKSGAGEPLRCTISNDGIVNLYGLIEVDGSPTRADGTIAYTVPTFLRPPGVKRITDAARSHNTDVLLVNFATNGELTIFGATNSTYFDLSGVSYCIENREPL